LDGSDGGRGLDVLTRDRRSYGRIDARPRALHLLLLIDGRNPRKRRRLVAVLAPDASELARVGKDAADPVTEGLAPVRAVVAASTSFTLDVGVLVRDAESRKSLLGSILDGRGSGRSASSGDSELLENLVDLLDGAVNVLEVAEPVLIEVVALIRIVHPHPNRLSEFEALALLDVNDCLERDGDLDALALVLAAEDDLLERLDPFVARGFGIGGEVPLLVRDGDLEVVGVLDGGLDGDAVVKVDVTIREVGVLREESGLALLKEKE
jgi:hypothetical protein